MGAKGETKQKKKRTMFVDVRNNIKMTKGRTGRKRRQCSGMTQAFLYEAAAFPPSFT